MLPSFFCNTHTHIVHIHTAGPGLSQPSADSRTHLVQIWCVFRAIFLQMLSSNNYRASSRLAAQAHAFCTTQQTEQKNQHQHISVSRVKLDNHSTLSDWRCVHVCVCVCFSQSLKRNCCVRVFVCMCLALTFKRNCCVCEKERECMCLPLPQKKELYPLDTWIESTC